MTVGTPPGTGPGLVDGAWLQGLANGTNESYISGVVAAGTTQANGTPIPAGIALVEIDTVPASSGVVLPLAVAGTEITCINTVATTLAYYANAAVNPLTGSTDSINGTSNSTAFNTSTSAAAIIFYCAKNGSWRTK